MPARGFGPAGDRPPHRNERPTVDANPGAPEGAAMPCLRTVLRQLALALGLPLLALTARAQERIPLPPGQGSLARTPGWTALAGPDLEAASRPTDPTDAAARATLLGAIQATRTQKGNYVHVLLHSSQPGTGALRLINAYAVPGGMSSQDVQSAAHLEEAKKAFADSLAGPGVTVNFVGSDTPALFAIGCLALHFEITAPEVHAFPDYYFVPANNQVQVFETWRLANDVDARGEIESMLRTFDGAKEGGQDPILRGMLIGGAAGAFAGLLSARRRRRRAQQAAARNEAELR